VSTEEVFSELRPLLFAIAYRMLGSATVRARRRELAVNIRGARIKGPAWPDSLPCRP